MPPPFSIVCVLGGGGGGGGRVYSITAVSTYVPYIPSVRTKNGFRSIAFEKISVFDSYLIQRYITLFSTKVYNHKKKVKFEFGVKSANYYGNYRPFSTSKKWYPFDIF